ncbi:putative fibroblast growth factor 1 [Lepisosteus oculatus]|uniref:Multifunctional fusion protein n=1 Tax=Lepisosteus oculatus TaxID=7918 RepID=W5MX08_LEPOC|nr:PREDICTED: fibroblast growth factor 1 [Lepisosteus oculatus]
MTEGKVTVFSLQPEKFDLDLQNYKKPRLLYCMNGGYFLQILQGGQVEGDREKNNKYNELQVQAVSVGVVYIKGTEAGQYLAMSTGGQLYGSRTLTDECLFVETIEENHYNTYKSQKYQDRNWYVGIKKNGHPKAGARTRIGQKAVYFLPLSVDDS